MQPPTTTEGNGDAAELGVDVGPRGGAEDRSREVSIDTIGDDGAGLNRAVFRLALPTTGAGWLKASFLFVDTWCAGALSTTALAGLSAAVFFVWMYHSLSGLNSQGALCHVAQARGRHDEEAVKACWRRGAVQALALGCAMSALFLATTPRIVEHLDLTTEVVVEAQRYLVVIALVGPAFWLFDCLEQCFRAVGDAQTPLWVVAGFALLNLALDPILALGFGPIPAFGIIGIGAATGLSWVVGAAILFVLARRRGYLAKSHGKAPPVWAFLRVGAPTALSSVGFDLIWVLMVPLIAVGGPPAVAAVSIGHRLESVAWLTAVGLGAATSALVGQAVGAGRTRLSRAIAMRAAVMSVVFSGAWSMLLIAFGAEALAIFTDDAATIDVGLDYIALAVFALVFQTLEVVFFAAFAGGGRTGVPSALALLTYGMRWPLAAALVKTWGIAGVFMAIGCTASVAGILVTIAYWRMGPGSAAFDRFYARSQRGEDGSSTAPKRV